MKKIALLLILVVISHNCGFSQMMFEPIATLSPSRHCAFTTLTEYNGCLYCAFRKAESHVDRNGGDNGTICVYKSENAVDWQFYDSIQMEGCDLRDPSLVVDTEGNLTIVFGISTFAEGKATSYHTAIAKNGLLSFGTPHILLTDCRHDWLWRIHWYKGKAYGFNYIGGLNFMESDDGLFFHSVCEYSLDGKPTETDFCIVDGKVLAIVRCDNANAMIGRGTLGDSLTWKKTNVKLSAPNILRTDGGQIYCFAKKFNEQDKPDICVFEVKKDTLMLVQSFRARSCDSGYQGAALFKGSLYMSYYDKTEEQANIEIIKMDLNNEYWCKPKAY